MSEIASISSRKSRIQKLSDAGDGAARATITLGNDPNKFLATVQIGITTIGILNGIVCGSTHGQPFGLWLQSVGVPPTSLGYLATVLVVVSIAYFSIVLGEVVPKRLEQITPEPIARRVARPMLLLAMLAKPFVKVLSVSTQLVCACSELKSLGVKQ